MTQPEPEESIPSPADPVHPGDSGETAPPQPDPVPFVAGAPPGLPPLEGYPSFDYDGNQIDPVTWEQYQTARHPRGDNDADPD